MKRILKKIFRFIRFFCKTLNKLIDTHGVMIIKFLNDFKRIIDSPNADLIVKLTRNHVDDTLLLFLRKALDAIFPDEKPIGTVQEQILKYVLTLKTLGKPARKAILFKIASIMLSDYVTNMSESDRDTIIQLAFKKLKDS